MRVYVQCTVYPRSFGQYHMGMMYPRLQAPSSYGSQPYMTWEEGLLGWVGHKEGQASS